MAVVLLLVARARNVALVLTFILSKPGYWFFRHRGNGWNTRWSGERHVPRAYSSRIIRREMPRLRLFRAHWPRNSRTVRFPGSAHENSPVPSEKGERILISLFRTRLQPSEHRLIFFFFFHERKGGRQNENGDFAFCCPAFLCQHRNDLEDLEFQGPIAFAQKDYFGDRSRPPRVRKARQIWKHGGAN